MIVYVELHDGDAFIDIGMLAKEVDAIREGETIEWRRDFSSIGVHFNIRLIGARKPKEQKNEEEKRQRKD